MAPDLAQFNFALCLSFSIYLTSLGIMQPEAAEALWDYSTMNLHYLTNATIDISDALWANCFVSINNNCGFPGHLVALLIFAAVVRVCNTPLSAECWTLLKGVLNIVVLDVECPGQIANASSGYL